MINGHLSEAQQGFATLEDVDEETFVRFIHWAYYKDYPAPEHTLVESNSETSAQRSIPETPKDTYRELDDDRDDDKRGWPHQYSSSWKGSLRKSFNTQYDSLGRGYSVDASMPGPRVNKSPEEDYSKVFLGHARMYVFAEKYDIQSLRTLAQRKLHKTLSNFTLFPERVGDITKLLEYVYANTAEAVDGIEDIRTMLAHYTGCEMEMLIKDEEFKDLMLHDGDMLEDFLKLFASRASCQCPFLLCFSGRQAPKPRAQGQVDCYASNSMNESRYPPSPPALPLYTKPRRVIPR